jgi:hypothetical protein
MDKCLNGYKKKEIMKLVRVKTIMLFKVEKHKCRKYDTEYVFWIHNIDDDDDDDDDDGEERPQGLL